jgi:hypothetical protein
MKHWTAVTLLVLATAAAACRGQSKPSKDPAGSGTGAPANTPGTAAADDPWKLADARPASPEERRKRAEAALERVATIQPKLAELRGLPMAEPVPAAYQSAEDFRAFVQKELERELPKDKADNMQVALLHMGLFMKPIDLVKVLEQTMTSQAAAYYDPATKKFFVVMAPDSDVMLDTISAHELTHALQDKHFDLVQYLPSSLDDDASIARRFVVEGDATFTMIAYLATATAGADKLPLLMKLIRGQVEQMANMGVKEYGEMMKQQAGAFSDMDDDMKRSMETIAELPPVIVGPLIDSYMKGALVSMAAYEAGGWKAIDALYKQPPESTEQVLHPVEKLIGKRDRPRKVTLPALAGSELTQNVVGELQWQIYFQQWGIDKLEASAGWGGDRYAVMKTADGAPIAYIATTWDTPNDAKEFHAAYIESLSKRFAGGDTSAPDTKGVARADRGKVFVRLKGSHVFIVDGAEDRKLLDMLAAKTTFK